MALKFYENYLKNLAPTSPDEAYRDLLQASINDQWDNTTQVIIVQEQEQIGSSVYNDVETRIDYAIDMGTGTKQGDDFKIFAFKDIAHKSPKGLMYQYDDDYWLVVNTSELGSITSEVTVRRCNNTMRWIDKTNGYIYEYPCVIEYVLESPQQLKDKDVITANGHITVMCQGDNITRYIEKNTRFIFNHQPFKLVAYQNMLNEGVKDNMASDLLYLDMYLDMEEPDDDLENNIANRFLYDYTIELTCPITEQVSGFSGQVTPIVKLNGEIVDREVEYSVNEYATIDEDGVFKLTGNTGNNAVIVANLKGNKTLTSQVEINIVDSVVDVYEIKIEPEFNTLKVGKSKKFIATLYKNGEAQNDVPNYSVSNLSDEYFVLAKSGKEFTLTAMQISDEPLQIKLFTDNAIKVLEVTFVSVF